MGMSPLTTYGISQGSEKSPFKSPFFNQFSITDVSRKGVTRHCFRINYQLPKCVSLTLCSGERERDSEGGRGEGGREEGKKEREAIGCLS
jgi:hypothetical protein